MTLLPGLPHSRGVHSEVAPLLVGHHQQDRAAGRVELLAVLHLLVGGAGGVQLARAATGTNVVFAQTNIKIDNYAEITCLMFTINAD